MSYNYIRLAAVLCVLATWFTYLEATEVQQKEEKNGKSLGKFSNDNSLSNHDILTKLGFTKLRIPPSHNRKRVASESRRHNSPSDSKMFVIKLPPNPYYYSHLHPEKIPYMKHANKKVPVGFKSNGKPGRIYHWNIPILKKFTGAQNQHARSQLSRNDDSDIFDIQKTPTWTNAEENNDSDKEEYAKPSKPLKKAPIYYVPTKPKHGSFKKYFSGNGKPKSFYVIEKNKKQSKEQRLLA